MKDSTRIIILSEIQNTHRTLSRLKQENHAAFSQPDVTEAYKRARYGLAEVAIQAVDGSKNALERSLMEYNDESLDLEYYIKKIRNNDL